MNQLTLLTQSVLAHISVYSMCILSTSVSTFLNEFEILHNTEKFVICDFLSNVAHQSLSLEPFNGLKCEQ